VDNNTQIPTTTKIHEIIKIVSFIQFALKNNNDAIKLIIEAVINPLSNPNGLNNRKLIIKITNKNPIPQRLPFCVFKIPFIVVSKKLGTMWVTFIPP
jgi:hypothetical protein